MQNLLADFSPIKKEEWLKQIEKELKGKSIDSLDWKIAENVILKPFYLADDIKDYPNKFKIELTQHREICEYISVLDVKKANKRALNALMQGANAIQFNCINSEYSVDYFNELLNEIRWEFISIHFVSNLGTDFVNNLYEWCNNNKIKTTELKGSICFDVYHRELLKGFTADEDDFKNFILTTNKLFPNLSNLVINATSYLNAGANVLQELAYTSAHLNEYLNLLKNSSLLNAVTSINVQIAIGSSYLQEIAKLRAIRILLQTVISKYNINYEIKLNAYTATINKSHKDAYNNMLRATTEVMAAIIGGSNSISAMPYDQITFETTEFSERIARNIHLILSEESYLDKVIDPAAGSYFIENLTQLLAQKAWDKYCEIEEIGGWKKALQTGQIIKEIERNAEKIIEEYKENKKVLIGVNKYPNKNDNELNISNDLSIATPEPNTLTELVISSML